MKKSIQVRRVLPLIWMAILGLSIQVSAQIADVTSKLNEWQTFDFPEGKQTGEFTFEFDMVPEKLGIDAVTGLTNKAAAGTYSDLSVIVRFNSGNTIDAYDGSGYASENELSYTAGTTYGVKVDVNASTMSYDVTVTPAGGDAVMIADDYIFRNKVINLTGMALVNGNFNIDDPGNHDVSNIVLTHISSNEKPVFVSVDPQEVNERAMIMIPVEAIDPLDGAITFTASGLPDFATFTDNGDNTGTITASPELGDIGKYTVTITASNANDSNTQDIVINVNEYSEIFTIVSDAADIDLFYHSETRNPAVLNWGGSEMLVGGGANWQDAADVYDMAAVMPFQIPTLPQGSKRFKSASFVGNLNNLVTWAFQDYDLYALDYRSASTVLGTDYYQGEYDKDETATAIQQQWVATGTGRENADTEIGAYATSSEGNDALVAFLNAQLTAGAVPGDYVFLRVSLNVEDAPTYGRIDIDSHESENPPVLNVSFYQPLVLEKIGDQVITQGETTTLNLSASFAETGDMVYSIAGAPAFAAITDNGDGTADLTLTPGTDDLGKHRDIAVTVTAGEYTFTETIVLSVTETSTAIAVDAADNYTSYGVDTDYDPATPYVWTGAPELLVGGSQIGAVVVDHSVVMPFQIPAIPEGMVFATAQLDLTTNQVPTWTPHGHDLTGLAFRSEAAVLGTDHYQGEFGGDASAYSIQEDFVTATTPVGATSTSEQANGAIVKYLNAQIAAGAVEGDFVFFRVNVDSEDATTWARVDINSSESGTGAALTVSLIPNAAPVFETVAAQTLLERRSLEVAVTASDSDGDPLWFELAADAPAFASLMNNGDGTASVMIAPGAEDVGEASVSVRVYDGVLWTTETFAVTVSASNLPVLAAIDDQTVKTAHSLAVSLSATDADADDMIAFSLGEGTPSFIVLTDNGDGSAALAIDPTLTDAGSYADVSVSATDGFDTVSQLFTLTVTENAVPVLTAIGDQSVIGERMLSVAISASDADTEDAVTLTIASAHDFVTLVDNGDGTGSIAVDATGVAPGEYADIVVSASDSYEASTETIKVTVVQNALPTLTAIGDQTLEYEGTLDVALSAEDTDGDALVFALLEGAPSFITLTDNGDGTGLLAMAPSSEDVGDFTASVTVSDGLGQALEAITVTVEDRVLSIASVQEMTEVYPNPAVDGKVNIRIPAEMKGGKLSIFALTGKLMKQVELSGVSIDQPYQLTLDQDLPKGQYILTLSNTASTITKHLVIQ